MTSSLVGSEMCIRDRVNWEVARDLAVLPDNENYQIPLLCRLALRLPRVCLLYTSDAADDM
eukprot:3788960-Prorocentrum_lima.AAC.1